MGGDCLNAGCVPSKALLAAARQAHAMASVRLKLAQPLLFESALVRRAVRLIQRLPGAPAQIRRRLVVTPGNA
jgi:pyruvate/2-oxoglutarate dehydrogenase complex dihydrolipoamide dehydrogenase (E3) component